jgi:hypothetical protein
MSVFKKAFRINIREISVHIDFGMVWAVLTLWHAFLSFLGLRLFFGHIEIIEV